MLRPIAGPVLLGTLLAPLSACAPEDDGVAPIDGLVLASDGGAFVGTFTADPVVPVVGENALDVVLTDADGAALPGVKVLASAWMPAMGHGAPTDPSVAEIGDGAYRVAALEYSMSGAWEVVLTVAVDGVEDSFALPVDVE